jgi:hypothetical protein
VYDKSEPHGTAKSQLGGYNKSASNSIIPNNAVNQVGLIPAGSGEYWSIQVLPQGEELGSGTISEADTDAGILINKVLATIHKDQMDYASIMAQIEFLEALKARAYNMVKRDGDIMNYYFDKKDNRQLDISEDLLKYIQYSISNELKSNEGSQIDDKIKALRIKAKELKTGDLLSQKGPSLLKLLNEQIAAKKQDLNGLNGLIDKVDAQQKDLNSKQAWLEGRQHATDKQGTLVEANYSMLDIRDTDSRREYYFMIGIAILMVCMILFWGYKLVQRVRVVFGTN